MENISRNQLLSPKSLRMARMMKIILACFQLLLVTLFTGCETGRETANTKPLKLIEEEKSEYIIVFDEDSPTDKFAGQRVEGDIEREYRGGA